MAEYATKQEVQELADRLSIIERGYVHRDEIRFLQHTLDSQSAALLRIDETVGRLGSILEHQGEHLDRLEKVWNERFQAVERDLYALSERGKSIEDKLDELISRLG